MKAQCQHCGHIQNLRRSSQRREDDKGRELFQCSRCHRYSPISKSLTSKRSDRSSSQPSPEDGEGNLIDAAIVALYKLHIISRESCIKWVSDTKTLKAYGIIEEPKPEPKPEPEPEPRASRPKWATPI